MVRFLSTFRLKEGCDPDETNRIWLETPAPAVKKRYSGLLRRYVISRITKASEEDSDYFGMAQLWFDDLETAIKARKDAGVLTDEFTERITDSRRVIVLDEHEVEL